MFTASKPSYTRANECLMKWATCTRSSCHTNWPIVVISGLNRQACSARRSWSAGHSKTMWRSSPMAWLLHMHRLEYHASYNSISIVQHASAMLERLIFHSFFQNWGCCGLASWGYSHGLKSMCAICKSLFIFLWPAFVHDLLCVSYGIARVKGALRPS